MKLLLTRLALQQAGGQDAIGRAAAVLIFLLLAAIFVLGGVGVAIYALYAALSLYFVTWAAALLTAAGLFVVAGLCLLFASWSRPAKPDPTALARNAVARYPLSSAATALLAGVALGNDGARKKLLELMT